MTVVLRNVPADKWRIFKSEAARTGVNLGVFFSSLVDEHMKSKRKSEESWKAILGGKAFLSEREAKEILKASEEMRKGFKMRY